MTLQEIKDAVNAGYRVNYKSDTHQVLKDRANIFLIVDMYTSLCERLTCRYTGQLIDRNETSYYIDKRQ